MAKKKDEIRILITGGGTGGHVSPALATVQEIKNTAKDWTPVFRYVGSKTGVEKRLAEEAGLDFVGVETGKLRRATSLRGLFTLANIKDAFKIPVGVFQSLWQVAKFRPDVIFSTGGFVCVPPVVAGWTLRVPVLTHEQTATVGLANRIAGRFARQIALSFEGSISALPKGVRKRSFVTGNPVRPLIFQGDRTRGIEAVQVQARRTQPADPLRDGRSAGSQGYQPGCRGGFAGVVANLPDNPPVRPATRRTTPGL